MNLIIFSSKNTACQPPTPSCDFSPDLRTVPGVLLPPPGVPGPPDPAFFVSRLLKKLASTPSLVWPAEHKHTEVTKKNRLKQPPGGCVWWLRASTYPTAAWRWRRWPQPIDYSSLGSQLVLWWWCPTKIQRFILHTDAKREALYLSSEPKLDHK